MKPAVFPENNEFSAARKMVCIINTNLFLVLRFIYIVLVNNHPFTTFISTFTANAVIFLQIIYMFLNGRTTYF